MHFHQLVDFVTRPISGTILDHVYTNHSHHIVNVCFRDIVLADHLPVFVTRKYHRSKETIARKRITYRNMKRFNANDFLSTLNDVPWDTPFVFDDIDDVVAAWELLYNEAVDKHAPWRFKRVARRCQPSLMRNEILELLIQRDNLLKIAKRTGNENSWLDYKAARNKVVNKLKYAKRKFYKTAFEKDKGNTKGIWRTIKRLEGTGTRQESIMHLKTDNGFIEDKQEIAEFLNEHFTTVVDRLRSLLPDVCCDLSKLRTFVASRIDKDVKFTIPPMTTKNVLNILKDIQANKSTGIDNIGAKILKIAAPALAPSITKIINLSLSSGIFPSR